MTRKARSKDSFKRRRPFRVPRKCILIVCEGEKTEPNYFNSLRKKLALGSVEVEIVGGERGSAPINVVNAAIERKELRKAESPRSAVLAEYDAVWCVMDVEAPKEHSTLAKAYIKARDNDLLVALSNPCFEYWYILHFEKTSRYMTTKDAHDILRGHCLKYRKNSAEVFAKVFHKTQNAITHAKEVLSEKHYGEDLRKCNPSTHVHWLVEQIGSMAAPPSSGTG